MVFSSVIFLYVFFPVFLLAYFAMPPRARNLFLLLASLFFYTWGEQHLVIVMLTSTAVDYVCGMVIGREFARMEASGETITRRHRSRRQRSALWVSVLVNLFMLGVFKYFNFAVDNYIALMATLGMESLIPHSLIRIILPLGISFYTFQSMSYTIDVYRRQVSAARNFVDFACFVSMFPQLIAGPIVRYRDVETEIQDRSPTFDDFVAGIRLFLIGLGKKMLIANMVAQPVDQIFALPHDQVSFVLAWTGTFFFVLQLYYDFAGYSDMAIGIGRMLGFHFPENFRYPYISKTVAEFWTRWHITLSTWLRDYLFISLGGYRVSRPRAYMNLLITFVVCGVWHGASWNFVLFGLIQAVLIVFERMISAGKKPFFKSLGGNLYLLLVVSMTMTVFRAEDIQTAGVFIREMVTPWDHLGSDYRVIMFLNREILLAGIIAVIGCVPFVPWVAQRAETWRARGKRPQLRQVVIQTMSLACLGCILLICSMKLAAGTYNPFIYFRF